MRKKLGKILIVILLGVLFSTTLNLIQYYIFNESYSIQPHSITSVIYGRLAYDNKNIEVFNLDFNEENVLWMTRVLEGKEFKSPMFEKKGKLPMHQYIVGFKDDKDQFIHIFDDGKAIIFSSSTGWFKPDTLVAYFTESEMIYLRSMIGK